MSRRGGATLVKGPALSASHGTYVARRADGAQAAFGDLPAAKQWLRQGDLGGTIRFGEGRGTDAEHGSAHWCQGCDRIVRGLWMAWTDLDEWRCAGCRHPGTPCPSVEGE